MIYKFHGYEFDTQSLLLSRGGESVDIRPNEAKLLAFLILNADQVVSKEQILSQVWQDKVVSEQAIFQNISHLRAVLGNDAIKTYPKRGYQWQVAVSELPKNQPPIKQDVSLSHSSGIRPKSVVMFALVTLMAIVIGFNMWFSVPDADENQFTLGVLESEYSVLDADSHAELDINMIPNVASAAFFQSPEWEYANLKPHVDIVFGGQLRMFDGYYYYEFLIKGKADKWQGVYSAPSLEQIRSGVIRHLRLSVVQEIVSKAVLPDIKVAQLAIAVTETPNDLIVLNQLVDAYISVNQLDNALVTAEKLEQIARGKNQLNPKDGFHLASSLLKQSQILSRKNLYQSSGDKLNQAMVIFEKIDDHKRLSDAWYQYSVVKHLAGDYNGVKASLLKASDLAASANDRVREIESLTYLSVLAHKNRQVRDQYHYLTMAEKRMKDYRLPDYHFAKIPFHYSMFTEFDADKVPHLKQVLAYCQLNPNYWVAQTSRQRLLEYYLKNDRIDEAKGLLNTLTTENAQNDYLKLLIARAEGRKEVFIELAQTTFEKAQLAGLYDLSLDVAMLLLTDVDELDNRQFYLQFIERNASQRWRRRHQEQLTAWSI